MKTAASIIICTKNRDDSLGRTLSALESIDMPEGGPVELLIVDNGSTDGTAEVVRSHRSEQFELRYILEPIGGQAHARNRGMAESKGEIIVFTDDDVLPTGGWLKRHLSAYADAGTSALLGRIEAVYVGPLPVWSENGDFSTKYGDSPLKPFEGDLVGANMSFRRSVPDKIRGFNVRLGPGRAGFFDDSDFSRRLRQAGFVQAYDPAASVQHVISSERLTAAALRKMLFQLGVSSFVADDFGASGTFFKELVRYARSSVGMAKFDLKRLLTRRWPEITHVDLFHEMERGNMWARLQGRKKLERLYDVPEARQ
jgi:glycosyltransferase involved in cell wall biosynthesis